MAGKDIAITVDDDRFRICSAPEDDGARRFAASVSIETPAGPRSKSVELVAETLIVALYLLDRMLWTGAKSRYVRNAMSLSMHELAFVLGEADQQAVVARERGEGGFNVDQQKRLKSFMIAMMPVDIRDRVRTMATRATLGDGERLFFWI
jgi:hypothetical protein